MRKKFVFCSLETFSYNLKKAQISMAMGTYSLEEEKKSEE